MLEIIRQAGLHGDRIAIHADGGEHQYTEIVETSSQIASQLLFNKRDLAEERVAFMISPGVDYVTTLWGIWQAGGVAVPICLSHPAPAIEYVLNDTGCTTVVASEDFASLIDPLCSARGIELLILESLDLRPVTPLPDIDPRRRAMILYTSGTTNLPKGVVTTHQNIASQIATLVKAWRWTSKDHTLCVLPLHHVHGIINVVSCSLWAGAR